MTKRAIVILFAVGACWTGPVPPTAQPEPPMAKAEPAHEPAKLVEEPVSDSDSPTTLTTETVFATVQSAYIGGIQRCYKELLKSQPDAKGKVKLAFEVDDTGRLANGKATSFSTQLEDCVTALMPSWRFPIPKDHAGTPTKAEFEIMVALVPS